MKTLLLTSLFLSVSVVANAGDLASGKNAKSKAPSFKTIDKNKCTQNKNYVRYQCLDT